MITGWGRYLSSKGKLYRTRGEDGIADAISANMHVIARGYGRAYGDAALARAVMLSQLPNDRISSFDTEHGKVTCEAGMKLHDLLDIIVPRGWFVPVTPGTKFVTIGGMIAADVHGKNHHNEGSFGDYVESLRLVTAGGRVVTCSCGENADLFRATLGGIGLTGVISSATFSLKRIATAGIWQRTVRTRHLEETMAVIEADQAATYGVAWLDAQTRGDAMGRGVVTFGEHATAEQGARFPLKGWAARLPRLSVPCDMPRHFLNPILLRAFNEAYFRASREGEACVGLDGYFYPLDGLADWNRLYGRGGLVQYQCVLPMESAALGLKALLGLVTASGVPSYLGVLKTLGEGNGLMSFPMKGYTLALDFHASAATFALFDELDAVTHDYGGRVYLAKDARLRASHLRRGYPQLEQFLSVRHQVDPYGKFSSLLSERLGL